MEPVHIGETLGAIPPMVETPTYPGGGSLGSHLELDAASGSALSSALSKSLPPWTSLCASYIAKEIRSVLWFTLREELPMVISCQRNKRINLAPRHSPWPTVCNRTIGVTTSGHGPEGIQWMPRSPSRLLEYYVSQPRSNKSHAVTSSWTGLSANLGTLAQQRAETCRSTSPSMKADDAVRRC